MERKRVFFFQRTRYLVLGFLSLVATYSYADKLLYIPVNPSFGGSPLNGSVLLGEANAQNSFKDPTSAQTQTFQDQLAQAVQNRIIGGLTNQITDSTGKLVKGEYNAGNNHISITTDPKDSSKTLITVTDIATGAVQYSVSFSSI
jgi:curli production assembly/transport component CsgF